MKNWEIFTSTVYSKIRTSGNKIVYIKSSFIKTEILKIGRELRHSNMTLIFWYKELGV